MTSTEIRFDEFIKDFADTLHHLFHEQEDINKLSLERGLPPSILKKIMDQNPLSVAVPQQYEGRGTKVKECLALLSAASYESLSLSLIFGINIALFIEPVAKYGSDTMKQHVFSDFIAKQRMGGLMITEPAYGSDALNMKTFYQEKEEGYSITGTKHWQGLTGMADYWLIACRRKNEEGELGRDIEFFITDSKVEKQQVVVKEYYDNLGLYMIPYGLNKLDLYVPKDHKLNPESTGIKMMLDILHRSRMQFPGMAMGFINRMLDEAIKHCSTRVVGNGTLIEMDQIQYQLARIQAAYTVATAMCARSSSISGIENNLAASGIEANSMKAVVTDLMQESAQLLVQVSGANGYRTSHIGGRGIKDSRPFQIFEGSNEMLYAQISESVVKTMKKLKLNNLYDYLLGLTLTAESVIYLKEVLNFELSSSLSQRKLVDLGRIIARTVTMGYVLDMGHKGFRNDMVQNCVSILTQDISTLVCAFKLDNTVSVIVDYKDNKSWMDCI